MFCQKNKFIFEISKIFTPHMLNSKIRIYIANQKTAVIRPQSECNRRVPKKYLDKLLILTGKIVEIRKQLKICHFKSFNETDSTS